VQKIDVLHFLCEVLVQILEAKKQTERAKLFAIMQFAVLSEKIQYLQSFNKKLTQKDNF
jgi:hypothetical protein